MWKSLKPATAIALALGLGGCAHLESPTSLMGGSNDRSSHPSVFPDKSDIDNQMRLADASLKSGNEAAAISMYRNLAREYPMALRPRIALGEALLAANAPQEAARAFEGALKLKGNSTQALVGLGRVELALHQPAKALENFDRAAKIDAKSTAAHNGRAVALDQLGRHDEAQAIYLDLLAKDPSNSRIRNNYALSLALAGKLDDSADILAGLAAAPDSGTRIRQNLALVYGLAGNDGQAAHVARMDLDEDAVNNNLEYYQRMRHASTGAKGAALVNPAKDMLGSSAPAAEPAAKTAQTQDAPSVTQEVSPAEPARQQRVEYRVPKNAKSNAIAADVSEAPREVAPLPARALESETAQKPNAAAEAKPFVGVPKAVAAAVETSKPQAAEPKAAPIPAAPVSVAQSKIAPPKAEPKGGHSEMKTQTADAGPAKRAAAVPAVGPAPVEAPKPVAREPNSASEDVQAKAELTSAKTAEKAPLSDAWAALEAAPQAPVFKKKSAKRVSAAASATQAAAGSDKPIDIKPAAKAAGAETEPAEPAAAPTSKTPAAPVKVEAAPSGTTAETSAVKSAPLKSEPLETTSKRASPAVPPVASLGEGVSGSIRPAMTLRPSSGAAFQAPAVPKLKFRDRKADLGREAAVPDKG